MISVQVKPERTVSRSAPIKGMNTAALVTQLEAGFAQRIDNFICRRNGLEVRPGYEVSATGSTAITSLLAYETQALARTDGDWIGDVVANPGGRFLFAAKGGAAPKTYNGSAWADVSVSGVSPVALVSPVVHGKRVFCIESGTLNIWYLPVDSIGGEAKPVFAGAVAKLGGTGVALGTDGAKLYLATSNGELIIYQGLDPSSPETWSFAGAYKIPVPVGRRCFAKSASGLMIACVDGLYPVPKILAAMESEQTLTALSADIEPTFLASGASGVIESDSQNLTAVVTTDGLLVRSGDTKGWSRLLGFNATCWVETANGLYFGTASGETYKLAGTEDAVHEQDEPNPIGCVLVDSFSKFGAGGRKRFTRIRPQLDLVHPYKARTSMLMDYKPPSSTWEAQHNASSYWFWPEVDYPMMPALWARPSTSRLGLWRGTSGHGEVGALVLGISSLDHGGTFIGCDYAFEPGGPF